MTARATNARVCPKLPLLLPLALLTLLHVALVSSANDYYARWDHLDSRPLPPWYDQAKVGVLLYWGVFSVPSFGSEWLWYHWKGRQNSLFSDFMRLNFRPNVTYQEFASGFTCEFYNPERWIDLLVKSGVRYAVFTAKHFEGYTLWPSRRSWNWNSVDIGSKRDLLGEFAKLLKTTTNIRLGVYYSLYEWFNPLFLDDRENNFRTNDFIQFKILPELYDVVKRYEPEVVWADGDWEAPDSYWESTKFLAWLYSNSTVRDTVVANDRWGKGLWCKHGDFRNCKDGHNPKTLQKYKFENVMTLDKPSWGYRRNAQLKDFVTEHELVVTLVETVSCGGNLLITLGPTHDGRIPMVFEERLTMLGSWLALHGEAVYNSKPWVAQNDSASSDVWYTTSDFPPPPPPPPSAEPTPGLEQRDSLFRPKSGPAPTVPPPPPPDKGPVVYAFLVQWPTSGFLRLGSLLVNKNTHFSLIGHAPRLTWKPVGQLVLVDLPPPPINIATRVGVWVLRVTNVEAAPLPGSY
ncbi:alpha-L-fucosidase-like [Amblyomma americanum]